MRTSSILIIILTLTYICIVAFSIFFMIDIVGLSAPLNFNIVSSDYSKLISEFVGDIWYFFEIISLIYMSLMIVILSVRYKNSNNDGEFFREILITILLCAFISFLHFQFIFNVLSK